eukprot:COSAG02_NODE_1384_length_12956_cov_126.308446_8_plen_443_part_00
MAMTYDTAWGPYPLSEAELEAMLVIGAAVTWKWADHATIPAGTAGEIVEIGEDGSRRVRFPCGRWNFQPEDLLLATPEQEAQWKAVKPELDQQAAAHAATLVVGEVVTWTGADEDIPDGTAGEIVERLNESKATDGCDRRVRFPGGKWTFQPEDLVLATPVQVAQWKAVKAELDKHAARMVVAAVVTWTGADEYIPAGTAGEIVKILDDSEARHDECIRVRFPGGTWNFQPEDLVLATPEQVAQWKAVKPELDERAAAHAATLVLGAVVTWKDESEQISKGTAGEIVNIKEDGDRRVRFPAGSGWFDPEELVLANAEQESEWATVKLELDAQATAQLPLVRRLFAMFDADEDGRLNKAEYKNYVQAIGYWAEERWTDEIYDSETGWKFECETLCCPPEDGVTAEAFETILYKLCRHGVAQQDLDRCMASCAAKVNLEPTVAT